MNEIYTLTKIDVAIDQLDWAIKMLIDHSAYVPAIALAGAAEEILGRFVGEHSAFNQLKNKISNDYDMTGKITADSHLNKMKIWIKHCDKNQNEHTSIEYSKCELESMAIQYIVRGITNLVMHDGTVPSELPRLQKWINDNRPDLDGKFYRNPR